MAAHLPHPGMYQGYLLPGGGAIQQELQTENQVLLRDVIRRHPLEKGLAELVAYVAVASENKLTIFDETNRDEIEWHDDTGRKTTATLPRIIFNRI